LIDACRLGGVRIGSIRRTMTECEEEWMGRAFDHGDADGRERSPEHARAKE
jgi:hypothetical protein